MDNQNYLNDIRDIKQMMDRSTQFLSLSGMAGVMAGIYALIGARFAARILDYYKWQEIPSGSPAFTALFVIAGGVMLLSVVTALVLSHFKARKQNEKLWNNSSRRLLANFLIPFVTGGIFSLLLIKNQAYGMIAPVMLLFYGIACVNASKYTRRDVRYLGMTIIMLGLCCAAVPGYGILFWALGFGLCHIVYGAIMYYKYDRK